jgi:5-methylcytosine-specific restriction enzyme A
MSKSEKLWTEEELKDSVYSYLTMQDSIASGKKINKTNVYKNLSIKWGRSQKSYERRMGNISAVLEINGRAWIPGLKPLSNVGINVTRTIEKYLIEGNKKIEFSNVTFELEVLNKYNDKNLKRPLGVVSPTSKKTFVNQVSRDPEVKAWLLLNSNGICECCGSSAPFISKTGIPYLEIHHVKRLSDDGPDTPENAVALCPNCHRALHYSLDSSSILEKLYNSVSRLIK